MSNCKVLAFITAFFYFLSASGKVCERLCELRSLPRYSRYVRHSLRYARFAVTC